MNIYANNQKVGNSFKSVKRKARKFQNNLSSGSIIELRYKNSVVKYKIETHLKDSRKTKGNLNVRFVLL